MIIFGATGGPWAYYCISVPRDYVDSGNKFTNEMADLIAN